MYFGKPWLECLPSHPSRVGCWPSLCLVNICLPVSPHRSGHAVPALSSLGWLNSFNLALGFRLGLTVRNVIWHWASGISRHCILQLFQSQYRPTLWNEHVQTWFWKLGSPFSLHWIWNHAECVLTQITKPLCGHASFFYVLIFYSNLGIVLGSVEWLSSG